MEFDGPKKGYRGLRTVDSWTEGGTKKIEQTMQDFGTLFTHNSS